MNRNTLVTVSTFSFSHEAQIALMRLKAENIPAFLADEHTINMQWLYSNALGGVKVQVPEQFVAQAQAILAEDLTALMENEFGKDERVCTHCGSSDLVPYTKSEKPTVTTFLFLGLPLLFRREGYQCNACGKFNKT